MKLRISGNTLRFRLARTEVDKFGREGSVEDVVQFGESSQLRYVLEKTAGTELTGTFSDGSLVVGVPAKLVENWAQSEEVSIAGSKQIDGTTDLKVLIEKDFVCLTSDRDEDQSDLYPHPKGADNC